MASLLPYLKRLEIVGVEESDTPTTVNNYLPIKGIVEIVDRNGDPWEPVPGPDPWDDLAIADGQGANWVGSNVYEIGQTVEARTAAFTGGVEPVTYRYRFITKAVGSDTWVNGDWTDTTNAKNPIFYNITAAGQIKFQSQAYDSYDPAAQLNSVAGIKTVAQTTIGTVAISPDSTSVAVMGNQTFTAVVTGGDATDLTYKWTVRSGNAQLDTPDNQSSATYTFIRDGQTQIQCAVSSANSSNSPQSNIAFVLVNA